MAAAAESAHRALLEKLTPMVDDAGFDLVTMSEDVTAKSTDAITGLVLGGVRTLQVLLTLRADGNLAAGLLNEAANVPDPAALQPLRERFDAAASHAKKLLGQLSAPAAEGPLRSLTETLIGFGASTGNLFDLRGEELRKVAAAQASLERSGSLLLQLGREATDLVATAQSNSDEATLRLARAIHNGKVLLLLITAAEPCGGDSDRNAVCDLSSGEANRENYPCDERARGGRHGDRRAGSRSDRRNRPDGRGARRLPRHGYRASEGEPKGDSRRPPASGGRDRKHLRSVLAL